MAFKTSVFSLTSVLDNLRDYIHTPSNINGFLKNSLCLFHSCEAFRVETCDHWQGHTLCFISHCNCLTCNVGHHYQERLFWIRGCHNVTVIAHLQIQHRQLNIIIIMKKKIKHKIMGKYVYCLLCLTS